MTGPLAPGWAGRIYGVWDYQNQGWTKNVVPGVGGEGNRINEWYLDAQIQGKISDRLDMWTKVQSAGWVNPSGGPGANSEGWHNYGYPTGEYDPASAFLYANTAYACNAGSGATNVVNPSPTGCNNPAVNNPRREAKDIIHVVNLPTYYSINSQWTLHSPGFDTKWIVGGTYYHYVLTGEHATAGEPIASETLPVAPVGLCGLGFIGPCARAEHQRPVPLQLSGTERLLQQRGQLHLDRRRTAAVGRRRLSVLPTLPPAGDGREREPTAADGPNVFHKARADLPGECRRPNTSTTARR